MIDVVSKSGAIYQYDDGDCIGDPGRYGSVFKGVTADGSPVAIKVVAYRTNSPTRLSEDRILAEPECGDAPHASSP